VHCAVCFWYAKILVLFLAFQSDQIFITGSGVDGQRGVITTAECISIRISKGDSFSKCTCAHMYRLDLEMLACFFASLFCLPNQNHKLKLHVLRTAGSTIERSQAWQTNICKIILTRYLLEQFWHEVNGAIHKAAATIQHSRNSISDQSTSLLPTGHRSDRWITNVSPAYR